MSKSGKDLQMTTTMETKKETMKETGKRRTRRIRKGSRKAIHPTTATTMMKTIHSILMTATK
jgi:hypothetical protein